MDPGGQSGTSFPLLPRVRGRGCRRQVRGRAEPASRPCLALLPRLAPSPQPSPPRAGERGREARLPVRMVNKPPSSSNQKGALPKKVSSRAVFKGALTKKVSSHSKEERFDDDVHRLAHQVRHLDDEENFLAAEPERFRGARLSGETTTKPASLPNQNGAQPRKFASRAMHSCFSIEENFLENAPRAYAGHHDGITGPPCRRATCSL